jgi:hypothetical protein
VFAWGTEEDSARSRHTVYFTVLAEAASVDGYKAKFQFSIPSSDRWADRENKSDSREYVEGLCVEEQWQLGQEFAICRVCL